MFIAGLDKKVNAEVLRLPESLRIEDMEFHEVLELAKRAEQTYSCHWCRWFRNLLWSYRTISCCDVPPELIDVDELLS